MQAHLLSNWIYDLCISPVLLDAVEEVIGSNILIQSADIFVKPAHGTKHINWHQDANYWGLDLISVDNMGNETSSSIIINHDYDVSSGSAKYVINDMVETYFATKAHIRINNYFNPISFNL